MRQTSLSLVLALAGMLFVSLSGSIQAQLSDVTQPGDPIVATSNNSPGSEGVANAIDNQPTKYLNFDRLNTGFTVTPRVGLSVVQCLTLQSANDAPERDPASYRLEGSYNGSNFTLIAEGPVPVSPFPGRFFKQTIRFENNTPYLAYRLIFPEVAGPGGNSMQIAEVELLGFLAPTDVTQPGDPITATSNNSPGSEGVANSIDNQPTKYLNFDRLNTGFTVTPSVGATLVSGITLTSANDAPERDPATYRLEGSLDGTSFFEIATGNVPAFPTRFYKNYIFFSNARAFRAYRLIFPEVVGPGGNSMQISEVELLGVVSDLAQDVTQPGDPIIATSNNSPGSEGVANAIDNQPTKYLNFDRLNTGFTVTPAVGLTIVSGLTLTSANDAPERDPADYTLEGSYDGTTFTPISNGAVPAFPSRFFKNTILFSNKVPYLRYRLIFPNVVGPGGNSMQISEVELLGVLAPTDVTVPGDPIVATSNNSPGSEGVANAIDNQPTKYLNFDRLNTGFTVTPGVGDTIVIGLTLTSANDAPERDPASYVLSGANDGSNFVTVAEGPVPAFPSRFFKNYIFFADNTKSFKSYRLIFPTVVGPGGNSMQISEVEFLGVTPGVVNTNPVDTLIRRQPQDTPVLLGQRATFRVLLTGPWSVQWFRNGERIAGANNATYTTPPTTAADDGARYQAQVQGRDGRQLSDEVMLNIFTPSAIESIGVSWVGGGANGAPTEMLLEDITGSHLQAYWNNVVGGGGTLPQPLNSLNQPHPTITVNWATSGEWGVGTGEDDPTQRMLNGMATSFSTSEAAPQTVTLSGVPAGSHSVILYTVQVPLEFFNMDFAVVTHSAGGADVIQRRYIRPLNSDEHNPSPGFSVVTATTPADRGVGNMMRFNNVQPGPDGIIEIRFFSPGRVDLPGGDPIRGPGLNALQLVLNPGPVGEPPTITLQPASANAIVGGQVTLSVEATGPDLSYQWLKNGQPIDGATQARLTLSNLQLSDAGNYSVVVSNPQGRVSSRTAVVEILANAQLTQGLIAYFKFDEGDGTVASNSAAGGQAGQVRGSFGLPDWDSNGQVGGALVFNGVTDPAEGNYVFVPGYTKLGQAMTAAGWVRLANPAAGAIINNWVEARAGDNGQFHVEVVEVDGQTSLRARIGVGPNQFESAGPVDNLLDVWHHFAVSANGSTFSIYWDGQLINVSDYLGTLNNVAAVPWLSIGAELLNADPSQGFAPGVPPFSGAMDDIALWRRSLSGIEVRAIYNGGLAGQMLTQIPPVLSTNRCPTATSQTVTAMSGQPAAITLTATDPENDALTFAIVTPPTRGTLSGTPPNVTYTAGACTGDYTDSFIFRASDRSCDDVATVTINVQCVPTEPNEAPSFVKGPDQSLRQTAAAQPVCVPGWATAISPHQGPRTPSFQTDFSSLAPGSSLPPNAADPNEAAIADGVLKLTVNANSQGGIYYIDDVAAGAPVTSLDVRFKLRIGGGTCCGARTADGLSFNFANNLPNPPAYGNPAEEGAGSGLIVCFDTWDNNGTDTSPAVDLRFGGNTDANNVASQAMAGEREGGRAPSGPFITDPATGQNMTVQTGDAFVPVHIHLDADGTVDVDYKNVRIFNNRATGYTPISGGRFAFGARTGGANDNHWIDDLAIFVNDAAAEEGQSLTFILSNSNPSLFSAQPSITADGTLCYTVAPGACGRANVTVVLMDDGGTAGGGQDKSAPQTFVINVPCNTCPVAHSQVVPASQIFTAQLDGAQEAPDPVNTPATGTSQIEVNLATGQFTLTGSYQGLSGPSTAAHIHGPAPRGMAAGVLIPIAHSSAPSGTLSATGVMTPGQIGFLLDGLLYVNVHSGMHPAGEIRGQVHSTGTVSAGNPIPITLHATDAEGDALTYQIVSGPTKGTLSGTPPNLLYTAGPCTGDGFDDRFTFQVSDGSCNSSNAGIVVIHVACNTCPDAKALLSSCWIGNLSEGDDYTVISVNGVDAEVTLDGSMSSDVDGNALSFLWTVDGVAAGAGAIVRPDLDLGGHEVELAVNDGACTATDSISVEVITGCEAVEALMQCLQMSGLDSKKQKPLNQKLKEACKEYEKAAAYWQKELNKGHPDHASKKLNERLKHAIKKLEDFQKKVEQELKKRNLSQAMAEKLIGFAQEIIDCTEPVEPPGNGNNCGGEGKPKTLVLRYNGDSCGESQNNQGSKSSCSGDPNGAPEVGIAAKGTSNPLGSSYFVGRVSLGATFTVEAAAAGEEKFGGKTHFFIYTPDGRTLLQTVQISTDCSAPLNRGESFGSLELVDYTLDR